MRLNHYLDELSVLEPSVNDIAKMIKKDCKLFLKSTPRGRFFWRGSEKKVDNVEKFKPRKDRRPLSIKLSTHKALDDLFNEIFGWRARSQGVFATINNGDTRIYGTPYLFFPIGNFKFLYSLTIKDLWVPTKRLNVVGLESDIIVKKDLEDLVKSYTDKNLKNVGSSEVMFKCKEYYLVNRKYTPELRDLLE